MYNKLNNKYLRVAFSIVLVLLGYNYGFSQSVIFEVAAESKVQITGTSSLHDWQMDSPVENCKIEINNLSQENVLELIGVEFQLAVNQLKSKHKKMDAIAGKALKIKKHPNIRFQSDRLQTIIVNNAKPNKIKGFLEIAGLKREVELFVITKAEGDSKLKFQFTFPIKMEDYAVEPPSFMFGAVTTGNDIQASFELYFNKSSQLSKF